MVARAEYDFSAASEEEISLRAGDMLNLAPKGESTSLPAPHHSEVIDECVISVRLSGLLISLFHPVTASTS